MKQYNIRFKFADDARYEAVSGLLDESEIKTGHWMEPFPNTKEDSQAFGMVETFSQDDLGEAMIENHGEVVAVEVSEVGDELDQLRQTNTTLRWHVRTLSREQANCDMMAVDFPRLEGTYNMVKDDPRLSPIADDLFKALMEAKAAYQAFDNSYNFFKNELSVALEGSPEMSDDEDDLANNTWVGMVEKLMEAWVQGKADLNTALGFIEALYSQQAMPDDLLNPEVDAFLKAHPFVEPTDG